MGFLETLTGNTKVLSFRIVFDDAGGVGVATKKFVSEVAAVDYVRLWACYYSKIVYVLGDLKNPNASASTHWLSEVTAAELRPGFSCFEATDLRHFVRFTTPSPKFGTIYSGEFYAKGAMNRHVKTFLPRSGNEDELILSSFALLQYAINKTQADEHVLGILEETIRNVVDLYLSGANGINALKMVPLVSYGRAIGLPV